MQMQLYSLQRQLWITCFYLLKLHSKEMLLHIVWQKFGVYAPCSHLLGSVRGSQTWPARDWYDGCFASRVRVPLKAGAELLQSHLAACYPSNSRYQNRYLACICSKSTASAGVLFGELACLLPVSHSGTKLARRRRARC